ncbi:MAG: MarC family protein [Rhodospirillaceae bacterium]|jgi:multiple antibiotic resistance protein|nr:MarC family protein [Rhodospirillaceae bacterium]
MTDILVFQFVTLFVMIDPVGVAALFVGIAAHIAAAERRAMAVRGVAIATVVLVTFAIVGDLLLRSMGISLGAFQIAGGVLFFLISIDMVFARQTGLRSITESEDEEAVHKADVSVFPFAIPLIAGPGAMTSVVLLMRQAEGEFVQQASVIIVLVAVLALTLAATLIADRVMKVLGQTGVNVVSRVLGLILAALAVQIMIDGLMKVVPGLAG